MGQLELTEATLEGEDHFGTIGEGENSARAPGADAGRVYWNYREPLQNGTAVNMLVAAETRGSI